MVTPICKEIKNASRQIWNQIEKGEKYSIPQQEETITETLLLYLSEKLGESTMKIITMNRVEEGENGADWEWHIHKNSQWLKLRVQAKILKGDSYKSLNQVKKKDGVKIVQLHQFIKVSLEEGFIPIYSFYNYISSENQALISRYVETKNQTSSKTHFPVDEELIGWTYATGIDVLSHCSDYEGLKGKSLFSNKDFMKMNNLVANLFCDCEDGGNIEDILRMFVTDINNKKPLLNDLGITNLADFNTERSGNLDKTAQNIRNIVILDLDSDATFSEKQKFDIKAFLKEAISLLFEKIKENDRN